MLPGIMLDQGTYPTASEKVMKLGWVKFVNHSFIFLIAVRVDSDLQVLQPLFEIR
jgi:hypothetical protein